MKPYLLLVIGALWIIIAVVFRFVGFGFVVAWPKGTVNPATANTIFRLTLPMIIFGWIIPTVAGLWLWVRK